jgi:hypothetical protein
LEKKLTVKEMTKGAQGLRASLLFNYNATNWPPRLHILVAFH